VGLAVSVGGGKGRKESENLVGRSTSSPGICVHMCIHRSALSVDTTPYYCCMHRSGGRTNVAIIGALIVTVFISDDLVCAAVIGAVKRWWY